MTPSNEELINQIAGHPKSKVGRAYRLGCHSTKAEIDRASAIIEDANQRIRELEAKLHPPPSKRQAGTLKIYWEDGSKTTIKLSNCAKVKALITPGNFLVIEQEGNDQYGEVINLAHVKMLSQS